MQLDKILVGVDFSDASLAAARWAARRVAPGGQLFLVHVLPEPFAPLYLNSYADPALNQLAGYTPGLYGALKGFGDALRSDRVRVGVRSGNPAATLARVAEEVKADLLCVGRGGRRQGGSRFGATTPQRLLAHARVPVLSVPSITDDTTARIGAQRIIAAVDARAGGDSILEVAAALASEWGIDLEAVHVVEAETRTQSLARYIGRLSTQNGQRSSADEVRRVGVEALSELGLTSLAEEWLKSRLAAVEGGARGHVSVRWGDPGPELVSYAQEHAALLVVGRESQRSPVVFGGNFPSGSTTRYVLWSAPCPVLVMPPIGATTNQRARPSVVAQLQPTRLFESSYSTPARASSVRRFGVHTGGDGDSAA